ncbi:diacylglycerol/lipid kinase family protein [Agromyces marinus]|uniref:Sphingosine kinase n=1 Tax=Agromyces marinus TaxID=1389020 RepID=A0ABN6YKZ0_9MICO|nr:diacylglycerol kinase family protein [Agromyces marinus]UIP58941.1 Diacylglycerol kinase [Agromyces marinus]BDZ56093.1 sphingosine kinase [Agromyces marinus]
MPPKPRRLLLAVNPTASFGRHRTIGPQAALRLEAAGYEVTVLEAANFELLRQEVQAAFALGTDGLVVVGGDGMVSLGVNVLARSAVPLGVIAAGTGNDLARALGLPHDDPEVAIDALVEALRRPPQPIDLGLMRHGGLHTWFACVLSAGFDAVVNERANRMSRPRGPSRYTLALLRELATFRPRRYAITLDGVRREQAAMLVSVANTPSLGGGMRIVPEADVADGRFDVFIVHPISRLGLLGVFPRVFAGAHVDHPAVEIVRAERVRLEADDIVAYADGERVGTLPIDVEIVPGALSVFA